MGCCYSCFPSRGKEEKELSDIECSIHHLSPAVLPDTRKMVSAYDVEIQDLEEPWDSPSAALDLVSIYPDVSADDLIKFFGLFLCRRCSRIPGLRPTDPEMWLCSVDIRLVLYGWHREHFITPGSVVFLYMMCRDVVSAELTSLEELQAVLLTCLFISYCYICEENQIPLSYFVVTDTKEAFWRRTLDVINRLSAKMMRINTDPDYYAEVFAELRNEINVEENRQKLVLCFPKLKFRIQQILIKCVEMLHSQVKRS
ncbi:cyclin-dependent kinase 5 activator 1-like [Hoplias malabaricus]|uniref:cyclin-dependent kinase 5 activator 1-like n=1 Tax=Hoplias malabaricus TaxID=27720 RepID=UPI0034624D73